MKPKQTLILAGVFLAATVAAGGVNYVYNNNIAVENTQTNKKSNENSKEEVIVKTKMVRLNDIMTNIANDSMLKISISVMVLENLDMENKEDILRDSILSYLRTTNKKDLNGVAGLDYLKSNLLSSAKHALGVDNVKEIFIREFVVQ